MARSTSSASELGSEVLLEGAQSAVDMAMQLPGIAEAEATIELTANSFCRFADVGPTQGAERAKLDVRLRLRLQAGKELREATVTGQ